MNTMTAAIAIVILLSPLPVRERMKVRVLIKRASSRAAKDSVPAAKLQHHAACRNLHHCINWFSWKIGISTASIMNTMTAAIAIVILRLLSLKGRG